MSFYEVSDYFIGFPTPKCSQVPIFKWNEQILLKLSYFEHQNKRRDSEGSMAARTIWPKFQKVISRKPLGVRGWNFQGFHILLSSLHCRKISKIWDIGWHFLFFLDELTCEFTSGCVFSSGIRFSAIICSFYIFCVGYPFWLRNCINYAMHVANKL